MRRIHYIGILLLFSALGFLVLFYWATNSPWRDISISIASAGFFAFLIEVGFLINDKVKFGYLDGQWERTKFLNRNLSETGQGYDDISDRYSQVSKNVRLKYKGDGEYNGTATYEEGSVSFSLSMNKENSHSGAGTYQYDTTKSQSIMADIGQYAFLVDKNRDTIYISHQNVLPSGNAKGLEIWQRKKAST